MGKFAVLGQCYKCGNATKSKRGWVCEACHLKNKDATNAVYCRAYYLRHRIELMQKMRARRERQKH